MLQKELLTKDYAAVGGQITHEQANDFVESYKEANPTGIAGYALGRNIIEKILAQPGCVGMRFHYGLNELGQKTLVYYGMDADGKDLITHTMVMENGVIKNEAAIAADLIWVFWR